ncbi:MAG: hypothetical protein QM482_04325 [Sulfurospirillum sp.]
MFKRYGVNYSVVLIKMDDRIKNCTYDYRGIIRLTDKYIKIDNQFHLLIFTFSNPKEVCGAIFAIEKKILLYCNLYIDTVFKAIIVHKNNSISSLDILMNIFHKIDEIDETDETIIEIEEVN